MHTLRRTTSRISTTLMPASMTARNGDRLSTTLPKNSIGFRDTKALKRSLTMQFSLATGLALTLLSITSTSGQDAPAKIEPPATQSSLTGNPIFREVFTADPAALGHDGTLYLYVGHDEAKGREMFTMKEWLGYSTKDMRSWTAHGPIFRPTDFKWAVGDAWAAQMIEKDGKFYFYTTVQHNDTHRGKAIGVAVGDNPLGPFQDAR